MKARIIPGPHTSEAPSLPYVAPQNVATVVVEEDGEVIAEMSVVQVTHFEGLWVHPAHRGKAGAIRALLRQAGAIPRTRGESWVFAGAADDAMKDYAGRVGVKVPMDLYAVWVGEKNAG